MAGGSLISSPRKALGGFPERIRTTLRYVEQITHTSTTGIANQYNFSGNSVFDPNYTGTGAQPANYDDWTVHYNRYRGIASSITLVITPAALTAAGIVECILYPTNSVDSLNSNGATAQPYALYTTTSTANPVVLANRRTTKSMIGEDVFKSDRLQAVYNADPSEEWLWNITVQSADASSTSSALIKVIIDYDVEFFDRISADIDARMTRLKEIMSWRERKEKRVRSSKVPLRTQQQPDESLTLDLPEVRQVAGGAFVLIQKERADKKKT